jgi:hypothetical protein
MGPDGGSTAAEPLGSTAAEPRQERQERPVWPLAAVALTILVAAELAAKATGSALVALSGVFAAAQLIVPNLVDHRRLAAARRAPRARGVINPARRGTGAVAWVRLDVKRPWRPTESRVGAYRWRPVENEA